MFEMLCFLSLYKFKNNYCSKHKYVLQYDFFSACFVVSICITNYCDNCFCVSMTF